MSSLKSIYSKFTRSVNRAFTYIKFANTVVANRRSFRDDYINNIYEIALVKVFTAWEEFLEDSFVAYLTGAKTRKIKPKLYLRKVNKKHALEILCGTQDYPDWTEIQDVYKLARLYFLGGKPFVQPLQEIENYFNDIKKIRNAIAHISVNSREKFMGLARSRSHIYHRNITPGEFLSGTISMNSRTSVFEYYISFLQIAAEKIIRL